MRILPLYYTLIACNAFVPAHTVGRPRVLLVRPMASDDSSIPNGQNDTALWLRGAFRFGKVNDTVPDESVRNSTKLSIIHGPVPQRKPIPPPERLPDPPRNASEYKTWTGKLVDGVANAFRSFLTSKQLDDLKRGFAVPLDQIEIRGNDKNRNKVINNIKRQEDSVDEHGVSIRHISWRDKHRFFKNIHEAQAGEYVLQLLKDPLINLSLILLDGERVGAIIHSREMGGELVYIEYVMVIRSADIEILWIEEAFCKNPPTASKWVDTSRARIKFI